MPEPKSSDARKEALAFILERATARGARIENQSDFQAILVEGRPVNHILHLLLSIFTLGFWLIVWIALAIFGGEKRSLVRIDKDGNPHTSKI